ncbi:MAG: InlB B-repeat-containing protein, partial [Oscillospiraceae bacterium]|nr:InlB B-repeat-containing protein [Oscillospiraceae bacterium]
MKKLISVFVITVMMLSFLPVSAATALELDFYITCNGDDEITVPTNTVITVSFAVENKAGEEFSLNNLQNEIYFDDSFFEFVDGSATVVKSGRTHSCSLEKYSDGENRVYVNSIQTSDYNAKETVATFKLKVKETRIGAKSNIVSKLPGARDVNGTDVAIDSGVLTVIVGEEDTTIKKYALKYYDDTKLLYTDSDILSGTKTNLRSAPTKTGYTFVGWEIDGKVYNAGSEYVVKANTTVKAKWEAKKKFILSFDTKGGSHVAPVSGYEGDTITITQRPTKSRYNFDGWYLNESCTQKAGSTIKLTADTTIYAKWSYESGGGGGGGGGG